MPKQIPLDKLQEHARQMTRSELEKFVVPDELWTNITLGVQFDGDFRIFELYVPGERPSDARVVSRARLNVYSGEGAVQVEGLVRKES